MSPSLSGYDVKKIWPLSSANISYNVHEKIQLTGDVSTILTALVFVITYN